MASENVELVRAILAASSSDQAEEVRNEELDEAFVAAMEPLVHPDFTFEPHPGGPEPVGGLGGVDPVYHGPQGYLDFIREWTSAFETWHYEAEELIDAGGDKVLVLNRMWGRTRSGGVQMEVRGGDVWTIRDGKGARLQSFFDRDEAREAAGLPPVRANDESRADPRS